MPRINTKGIKKRRLDCKQCSTPIRGNYNAHEKRCRKKHGDWLGWDYYAMDGTTEITKDKLPTRKLRDTQINANKAWKEGDPQIAGWKKLKKSKWTCNKKLARAGLQYVMEKLLANGMPNARLERITEDAIDANAAREDKD